MKNYPYHGGVGGTRQDPDVRWTEHVLGVRGEECDAARMHARHRLGLAAMFTDLGLYLLMLSLPYRLLERDASSAVIGLVPLMYAAPYGLVALLAGRVSDRFPRRGPIRVGLALAVLATASLAAVDPVPMVLSLVVAVGVGLGFFWPSVQAGFSEVAAGRDLHGLTRLFNVSWSTGKGLGLLFGGLLLGVIGSERVPLVAAASFAASAIALPPMARPGDHSEAIAEEGGAPPPRTQRAFRRAAWIANGISFGVAATVNHHLPKVLLGVDIGGRDFGIFFGSVFLAQTLLFVTVGNLRAWHYRALPLVGMQVVLAIGAVAVTGVESFGALMLFAPLLGAGLGFAYQSSLYYSLHAPVARGAQAGVHEAALGLASATIPVAGGFAVAGAGVRAPFVLAAACMLVSAVVGTNWIRRSFRSPRH